MQLMLARLVKSPKPKKIEKLERSKERALKTCDMLLLITYKHWASHQTFITDDI